MAKKEDKNLDNDKKMPLEKASALLADEREHDSQSQLREKSKNKPAKPDKEKPQEARVRAKFLRISPKKVRLVINVIRGLNVLEAIDKLQFINKKAVRFVIKALNSAMANAENNFKLKKENLFIKKIIANEGPALHRWEPRAFGRAAAIKKRTTHLEIFLAEKIIIKDKNVKKGDKIKIEKKNKFFKREQQKDQKGQIKPEEKKSIKTEESVV